MRIFKFGDNTFEDPGEDFSIADVKKALASSFPEINNSIVEEETAEDGTVTVTFVKRSGTKGIRAGFQAAIQKDPKLSEPVPIDSHVHLEAYYLLRYECASCDHLEKIWNSRDGRVPVIMVCSACNKRMLYRVIDGDEQYAPYYLPVSGQGVFIDLPASLKLTFALRQVTNLPRLAIHGSAPQQVRPLDTGLIHAAGQIAIELPDGMPFLIRWP